MTTFKKPDRFDLEQELLSLWAIKDDLAKFHWLYIDCPDKVLTQDDICNMLMAIENILDLRMYKTWDTFCQVFELDNYRSEFQTLKEDVE
jgi:hypothetical protein